MSAIIAISVTEAGPFDPDDPAPWEARQYTFLEGMAEGADGRAFRWEIITLASMRQMREEEGEPMPDLQPIDLPGIGNASVVRHVETDGFTWATVVVDLPTFGFDLVEALRTAPDGLRPLIFTPIA